MKRWFWTLCVAGLLRGGFAAPRHTFEVSMEKDAFLLDDQWRFYLGDRLVK
jgi:hypothetical protein